MTARQRLEGTILAIAHGALAVGTSHGLLMFVEESLWVRQILGPDTTHFFARLQVKIYFVFKIKMITALPPVRPVIKTRTNQKNRTYYTIHSNENNAFTLRVTDDIRTAIVGFRNVGDAALLGAMIETYYIEKKEWPDMSSVGNLILPEGRLNELVYIFIRQWEFDELKVECTRNILDMISVEEIVNKNTSYSLSGNLYSFDAPDEFYRNRFDEIYEL